MIHLTTWLRLGRRCLTEHVGQLRSGLRQLTAELHDAFTQTLGHAVGGFAHEFVRQLFGAEPAGPSRRPLPQHRPGPPHWPDEPDWFDEAFDDSFEESDDPIETKPSGTTSSGEQPRHTPRPSWSGLWTGGITLARGLLSHGRAWWPAPAALPSALILAGLVLGPTALMTWAAIANRR